VLVSWGLLFGGVVRGAKEGGEDVYCALGINGSSKITEVRE